MREIHILRKKKQWAAMAVLAIILLGVHTLIQIDHGDDLVYAEVYDASKLFSFLAGRYMGWSSRVVIEVIMLPLTAVNDWVWRILNICMILLLTVNAGDMFGIGDQDERLKAQFLFFSLIWVIPVKSLSNAGWITTTTNYLWPLALGSVALRPLKRLLKNEKCKLWEWILCPLCAVYAANMEQMCAILLGSYIAIGLYLVLNKRKINALYSVMFLLIAAMMVFILTAPGNAVRTVAETERFFPEYVTISALGKFVMGVVESGQFFLAAGSEQGIYVFGVLAGILVLRMAATAPGTDRYVLRLVIAAAPFAFYWLFGQWLRTLVHEGRLTKGLRVIGALGENRHLPGIGSYSAGWVAIQVIVYVLMFLCVAVSVYLLHGKSNETLLQLLILAAGLASKVIMGFSPTVYASGERTSLFASAAILIVTMRNLQLWLDTKPPVRLVILWTGYIAVLIYCNFAAGNSRFY